MPDPTPCARCGGTPHLTRWGTPACTGHSRTTGKPCTAPPMHGQTVCRMHGGSAKQNRAAGQRRTSEEKAGRELARLGRPVTVDPSAALLDLVHWTAGEVEFWRAKVVAIADTDEAALTWGRTQKVRKGSGEFPGTDTTHAAAEPVAYRLMVDASNRLAAYAAAALKAGVEERRVRLAESQGEIAVQLIRRILDALYLALVAAGFTEDALQAAWLRAVEEVVPREIRAMDALTRGA